MTTPVICGLSNPVKTKTRGFGLKKLLTTLALFLYLASPSNAIVNCQTPQDIKGFAISNKYVLVSESNEIVKILMKPGEVSDPSKPKISQLWYVPEDKMFILVEFKNPQVGDQKSCYFTEYHYKNTPVNEIAKRP